jgi:tetratricopeptide (TPR) repeat protein
MGDGEYLKANHEFELAIKEYDANASLYFIGGQVAVRLDRLNDADKHYKKSIELDNKNKDYRLAQEKLSELNKAMANAKNKYDIGLINDSIIEYEKLTSSYPEYAIVFYNLGMVYKESEEYDLAVQNYKKAGELNPFEDKYVNSIKVISNDMIKNGDAEYRIKEFDTAMDYYNKSLHYAPKYAPTYFKVANVYLKLQDIDKAIESLKIGLSYDSSYAKIHLMLGKLYKKKDKIKLAKISINSAININSNYTKAYFELGQIYFNENNYDFAIKEYKNAINSDSTYKRAYLTLGLCEMIIKNYDNAELYYSKAFSLDDKYIDAYYRLSEVYNLQQRYKEAKEMAKKAIYIKQNYAPALYELGFAEMYLCNIVAAKDAFEKAKKDRSIRPSANKYLKDIGYYTKDCN